MPPKEPTPKQISSGLSYVHKEAPFLARLKEKNQNKRTIETKFEDYIDGQDDDDYDELEGAQIVELDSKGREIHKDEGEKSDSEKEDNVEKEDDQPAVDENGRILFRKQQQKSSLSTKRKLKSIIDEEIATKDKKKKKKSKSKPTSSLLSFNDDEE
ncbi:MAG: hypothetical protein EXX96DRAFT_582802 [Benjaminiella poitrasii]|nr:MAG: hypothetical protein EXX96DRAFT_582802 [Benjaminiella poitrasii]